MFQFQFQILRKLSQDPVHTAMPSSVTPRQLTRLSWPASTPARSTLSVSQTLTLKSSYPAMSSRPDLLKATEVQISIQLGCLYQDREFEFRFNVVSANLTATQSKALFSFFLGQKAATPGLASLVQDALSLMKFLPIFSPIATPSCQVSQRAWQQWCH